jgi:hypothetical protein
MTAGEALIDTLKTLITSAVVNRREAFCPISLYVQIDWYGKMWNTYTEFSVAYGRILLL